MNETTALSDPRPIGRADREDILSFARDLPDHDLLFLMRDVTQDKVVDAWLDAIDDGSIHSQMVNADGKVAGYNALVNDQLSWSPHMGEIRIAVSEDWRGRGVGRSLALEAINKAIDLKLEKLIARMTTDQHGAVTLFEQLGFRGEALLRNHVKDKAGKSHDLAILSLDINEASVRHTVMGLADQ